MRKILKLSRSLVDPVAPIAHSYEFATFDPEISSEAWLDLNNKIFKVHPDQGNWALADLENRMREPYAIRDKNSLLALINRRPCVGWDG